MEVLRAICAGFNHGNEPEPCLRVAEDNCRPGSKAAQECAARCAPLPVIRAVWLLWAVLWVGDTCGCGTAEARELWDSGRLWSNSFGCGAESLQHLALLLSLLPLRLWLLLHLTATSPT